MCNVANKAFTYLLKEYMLCMTTTCTTTALTTRATTATTNSLLPLSLGVLCQSVSRSSYACLSTSVCMEWDRHICRRCACRSRHCLAVVICVDNLPFLVTDLQQLAEGHSLSLARQLGTVSRRTWMITHSIWTLLNVSLNHFCFRCTDNAFSTLEISSKW